MSWQKRKNKKNAPRDKEGGVSAQIIVHLVLIRRKKNATTDRPVMSALQSDSLQVPKTVADPRQRGINTSPDPERRARRKKKQRKADMER